MEVFISWSGDRSKDIASALKHWLPDVFMGLQVWMSDHDIYAGAKWEIELGKVLKESKIGILCLTPESLKSHWITFEAGALSTAIAQSRVIPYRFELQSSDIAPPLSQFQDVGADKDGTRKLVRSINDALGKPWADEERLIHCFELNWQDLQEQIKKVPAKPPEEIRSDRELLKEILELARQAGSRDLNSLLGRVLNTPNVLKVEVAPKQIAGEVTNRLALRIIVKEKLPLAKIPADQLIPATIFGMPTDVVEDD